MRKRAPTLSSLHYLRHGRTDHATAARSPPPDPAMAMLPAGYKPREGLLPSVAKSALAKTSVRPTFGGKPPVKPQGPSMFGTLNADMGGCWESWGSRITGLLVVILYSATLIWLGFSLGFSVPNDNVSDMRAFFFNLSLGKSLGVRYPLPRSRACACVRMYDHPADRLPPSTPPPPPALSSTPNTTTTTTTTKKQTQNKHNTNTTHPTHPTHPPTFQKHSASKTRLCRLQSTRRCPSSWPRSTPRARSSWSKRTRTVGGCTSCESSCPIA
jgi:hypothetical protein